MRVFCDTSVLVAASLADHPDHDRAREVVLRVKRGDDAGTVAAHSLAETYAVLTRLPGTAKLPGATVLKLLSNNVAACFEVVSLSADDYLACLNQCAGDGVLGGRVYDALILAAAIKSRSEVIYTFDLVHFRSLAPSEIRATITAP